MGSVFLEVCPDGQYPSETEFLILHVLLFSEGVRLHSLSPPPFPIHGEPLVCNRYSANSAHFWRMNTNQSRFHHPAITVTASALIPITRDIQAPPVMNLMSNPHGALKHWQTRKLRPTSYSLCPKLPKWGWKAGLPKARGLSPHCLLRTPPPPLVVLQPISQTAPVPVCSCGMVFRAQRISRQLGFPRDVSRGYRLFINAPGSFPLLAFIDK